MRDVPKVVRAFVKEELQRLSEFIYSKNFLTLPFGCTELTKGKVDEILKRLPIIRGSKDLADIIEDPELLRKVLFILGDFFDDIQDDTPGGDHMPSEMAQGTSNDIKSRARQWEESTHDSESLIDVDASDDEDLRDDEVVEYESDIGTANSNDSEGYTSLSETSSSEFD